MKLLKKGMFFLLCLSLIVACSDDDGDSSSTATTTITNLDFTITTESGSGNTVSVLPSATGATLYEVDFGDNASTQDVLSTAGPKVTYAYPSAEATYTITVTASATGAENVVASKEHSVVISVPQTDVVGRWVLLHDAGALGIGPSADNFSWWSNKAADVTTRACLFDDVYEFKADGTFVNTLGDDTWLENTWDSVSEEGCGSALAPFDGTASATWYHDESAGTIKITGKGAFLGLAKVANDFELVSSAAATESITYKNVSFSDDKNTMTVQITVANAGADDGANAYWQFKFAKEGSAGAMLDQTDSDSDGVIDVNDGCPNTHGGGNADGCPSLTAPTEGAPVPTTSANDVIAIFSDTYTPIAVSNWNPGWGQATEYSLVDIAGNSTVKYDKLNYQGIELNYDAPTDISGKTKVRFDYWTPNADNIAFKVVNTSKTDLAEKESEVATTSLTSGSWQTVEISLSEYTSDLTGITQLVFSSTSENATFYIDNLYFY